MNPETNHLVTEEHLRTKVPEKERGRYLVLAEDLMRAARQKLAGKQGATVARRSGGKLSKWAAARRAERLAEERQKSRGAEKAKRRKRKARRKMERESRRANR